MIRFAHLVKTGTALAALLVAPALAGPAPAQDAITLKLGHFLPTANGMHRDFLEPWSRDLEACSKGQVKVEIYPAGTQLGNIARLYDGVQAGALDLAHGLMGVPAGRFHRTLLIELPFMAKTSAVATRALWNLFDGHLAQEFPGVKVLALHTTNGGQIHTSAKQVRTAEDLKGLRIRFPSAAVKTMLEHLGATPVGLPPTAVYENLERNVIDGTVFTWDAMQSFKLAEVTRYHLDAKVYVASFWFAINQQRYDSLPAEVRACVDTLSGDALVSRFGDWWDSWDKAGLDLVQTADHITTEPSADERARWQATLAPMIDAYLAGLEKEGVQDARAVYEKLKAEIARLEK